jgi:hypothetical protein
MLALQHALGNRATTRLLQRQAVGASDDPSIGPLSAGDHVWEWNGRVSMSKEIPRARWFPGSTGPNDYLGHGREIFEYVVYPDHVKRGQPHMRGGKGSFAWLNNNPGNLTAGGANVGEYPDKRNWHNFLIFPSREAGMDAIPKFLKANRYGPLSLSGAFRKYAPKGDGKNDPEHYAQSVVDALAGDVTMDTTIDELTEEQLKVVAKAIAKMEGSVPGQELPLTDPSLPTAISSQLQGQLPGPSPSGAPTPEPAASGGGVITIPEVTIVGTPDPNSPTPEPAASGGGVITIPEVTIVGTPDPNPPPPTPTGSVAEGIDYGWGNFEAQSNALTGLGGTFVCRYLSYDKSKNLSRREADRWASRGVSVVVVWESGGTRANKGFDAGASDARKADEEAKQCGQPDGRPIYFAVDFDATGDAVSDYFDGVASVLGVGRTGAYGGIRVINALFDTGRITYGWQTLAWSKGKWDPRAQLRQIDNDPHKHPRGYDRDRAMAADFGQWQPA